MHATLCVFMVVVAGASHVALATLPTTVGVWVGHTNALPDPLLPDVPLLGNGAVGALLDARNSTCPLMGPINPATLAWGRNDTTDVYLNSNSFWSCGATPGSIANASCGMVALGGVSLSLAAAGLAGPLRYEAWQAIGNASVGSAWTTTNGGVLSTLHYLHPSDAVLVSELRWTPGAGDPAHVAVNVSTWANGASGWRASPYPFSMGCFAPGGDAHLEPVSCSNTSAPQPQQLLASVTRGATAGRSGGPIQMRAGLATGVARGSSSSFKTSNWALWDYPGVAFEVIVEGGTPPVLLVTAEAENSNFSLPDPSLAAAALALSYMTEEGVARVGAARDAFWGEFWGRSSVVIPQQPALTALWEGASYVLGSAASTNASVPPPALYGPWATSDACGWQGDMTLDYNFESTFFGAFSSNHAPQFASYITPLLDFVSVGLDYALLMAAEAKITCLPGTLNFPCHLAPWGLTSFDRSTYMQWNGLFSLLPLASAWEFTQDLGMAATMLPLFVGHMQWWACYLVRDPATGLWHDANAALPDQEHEGQTAPDPMIALALLGRVAAVTLDLGVALNISLPAAFADIYWHLAPFPTNGSDGTAVWTSFHNATPAQSDTFAFYPIYPTESLGGAQPLPEALRPLAQRSVRAYTPGWNATSRPLDVFVAAILALAGSTSEPDTLAYTAEEVVAGLTGWVEHSLGRNQLGYAPGGGVENAGVARAVTELLLGSGVLVPATIGGGGGGGGAQWYARLFPVFNATSMGPASFTGLVAKGGCVYGAGVGGGGSGGGLPARVASPVSVASLPSAGGRWGVGGGTNCTLLHPWQGQTCTVSVACGGSAPPIVWVNTPQGLALSFLVPNGVECSVQCA